ncbi:hypothetical protein [Modicisalibacter xianhensis]|uniref:Tyrosine specific protein phosphatases domain-containing protein n=1 Tax=Modicisalibacter xianhensis TaxID=442341 RepID=A0A1I3EM53_9GAMM|nr:hypothetical protein [Halomonas xianhensis]SFI00085.1 hypothetical protein SAMN04487959_11451 [Halomonas xianhensis]
MITSIEYTSRRDIERRPANADTVVLSIRGIDERSPRLAKGWTDVLSIQFDDVVPGEGFGCEEPMTLEDARTISGWIRQWASDRRQVKLVIHCNAGVSRSAAVALWAGASLNRPAQGVEGDGRDANPHVRSLLDRTAA